MSTNWHVRGDYFETCNCDFLCPCLTSNIAATPTHGHCDVAMIFRIEEGNYDGMALNGLSFAVVAHSPEAMGAGNWALGLITDERATPEQQQAMVAIASGQAGGPMAALAPLVGEVRGVEARPIRFEQNGMTRSVSIAGIVNQACEGMPGVANPEEPLYLDNTLHPANPRVALAKSTGSHIHAFGIDWDDDSGNNNGHFAPFDWRSA